MHGPLNVKKGVAVSLRKFIKWRGTKKVACSRAIW